jgi:hypothetical protein
MFGVLFFSSTCISVFAERVASSVSILSVSFEFSVPWLSLSSLFPSFSISLNQNELFQVALSFQENKQLTMSCNSLSMLIYYVNWLTGHDYFFRD